ncbi:MAG: hypothetical protein EBY16_02745 [Gammaproteobacteria bacterium]|nr:hypothetical protein [Gammaproteobacteria bacterium]
MLKNLASAFVEVEKMVAGAFYVIGVGLFINGVIELRNMNMGHQGGASDKHHIFMKIVVGVFFIYLPSTLTISTATLFGNDSVLSFISSEPINVYEAIKILMQLAGLIWFGRGLLMFFESNEQARLKSYISIAYIFAGICALNLDYTIEIIDYFIDRLMMFFKTI